MIEQVLSGKPTNLSYGLTHVGAAIPTQLPLKDPKAELQLNWEQAQARMPLAKIDPLP